MYYIIFPSVTRMLLVAVPVVYPLPPYDHVLVAFAYGV
jgi:hypothetical protein